jgi:hypothetical protein
MRLIAALALLLAPFSAHAGQRATYTDNGKQQLVILVADNGYARVNGPDPEQYGLLRDGQFYLVAHKDGQWTVARTQDVAAAFAKVMPAIFGSPGAAAGKPARKPPRIVPKGKRTHLGREGQLYHIYFAGDEKPDDPREYLISADPALKPVGAALEQFTLMLTTMMGALIGPAVAELNDDARAVFALGTPLDMEQSYKLLSLETVEVAHEAMELPAKPQTVEQIVAQTEVRALTPDEMAQPMPGEGDNGAASEQPDGMEEGSDDAPAEADADADADATAAAEAAANAVLDSDVSMSNDMSMDPKLGGDTDMAPPSKDGPQRS